MSEERGSDLRSYVIDYVIHYKIGTNCVQNPFLD